MNTQPICTTVVQIVDGAPHCASGWVVQQVPEVFDISQLDMAVAMQHFTAGFMLYFTWWVVAKPMTGMVKSIIETINFFGKAQ